MGKSKKSKQTTKIQLDPQTMALNEMRLQQERNLEPVRAQAVGELGRLFNPANTLPTGTLRSGYRMMDGTQLPGLSSGEVYGNIAGLQDLRFASPEEAFSASRLAALTDVSGLQSAARKTIDKTVAPQLLSQAIASGMGRGGAGLEAIANAAAQFNIPIEQARIGAEQNLAQYISGRGERRQQFAGGLSQPTAPLTGAPTTTQTTKGPGKSPLGSILGAIGTVVGGIYGGPTGAAAGGTIGGTLGGGGKSQGVSPGSLGMGSSRQAWGQ